MFVLVAGAAVVWSLVVLRASFSRRHRSRTAFVIVSILAIAAAAMSIFSDLRTLRHARNARPAALSIHLVWQKDWWRIDYAGRGAAFTTANELHVPAGSEVDLSWSGAPAPSIEGALCLPRDDESRCALVAEDATEARFLRVWPPMSQRLPVVVDPPARFERWLREQAAPARASTPLFDSAGCSYCHVIRGVAASPSEAAPDLTHFASRRTIASTPLPNERGFLEGWIVHSGALKHGSLMPQNRLDPRVLHALTNY